MISNRLAYTLCSIAIPTMMGSPLEAAAEYVAPGYSSRFPFDRFELATVTLQLDLSTARKVHYDCPISQRLTGGSP